MYFDEIILLWNKVLIQQPFLKHEVHPTLPIQALHVVWLHIIMSVGDEAQNPMDSHWSSAGMTLLMFLSTVTNTLIEGREADSIVGHCSMQKHAQPKAITTFSSKHPTCHNTPKIQPLTHN